MRPRISATVAPETIRILKELVRKKKFRNASHAIETAIEFLKKSSEEEKK